MHASVNGASEACSVCMCVCVCVCVFALLCHCYKVMKHALNMFSQLNLLLCIFKALRHLARVMV